MINKPIFNISSSKNAITLIGEILVDEIKENGNETLYLFGGSPANIAINLKDLGDFEINLFGTIGNDKYGDLIIDKLVEKNIETKNIKRVHKRTSVVKINKTSSSPVPIFRRDADCYIEFTDDMENAIKNSAIVHFSFWPLSVKPAKDTILRVLEVAKKYNTLIGFDPNFHISLVTDDSPDLNELKQIMSQVDIMKPSLDDSVRLFGPRSTMELINTYSNLGVKLVVMTLGKDGLLAKLENEIIKMPTLATKIIDATGAGDAFYSGMYIAILNNESINVVLKSGSACSAYNLEVVGGISNLPRYEKMKSKFDIGE